METMNPYIPERRQTIERRAVASSSNVATTDEMSSVDWAAMILLIVGGLNWGLIGLFNFDLVAALFGPGSTLSHAVYTVVGFAALYSIYTASKMGRSHR